MPSNDILNFQVFRKNPKDAYLPNAGVTEVREPKSSADWAIVDYELSNFICNGAYHDGLARILGSYINHLDRQAAPAAWVSGFFGSGKSHLVRVLEFLWRDLKLENGATARSITRLPDDIKEKLVELTVAGRKNGGLWSAGADMRAFSADQVRLAVLKVFLAGAGLPLDYSQAQFVIWLKQEGFYDAIEAEITAAGQDMSEQLRRMYVSPTLKKALLKVCPSFAATLAEVGESLERQFPSAKTDVGENDMLSTIRDVMRLKSTRAGTLPCTLIVLDEVQQYLNNDTQRAGELDNAIKSITTQFESKLLVVATGQSALGSTGALTKLKDRFTVYVSLSDTDVDSVIREVVLRKAEDRMADVKHALAKCAGEISRHLPGTQIETRAGDEAILCADYPLLPVRRRFWEKVLRAIDTSGAALLRTQLRVTLEAVKAVADRPLGTVLPADFIYEQQAGSMEQTSILNRETAQRIEELKQAGPDGPLASRICATVFLINQINKTMKELGIRATADTLADLLVEDLVAGSGDLRRRIPPILQRLVDDDAMLMQTGDEFIVQTRVGQEWEKDRLVAYQKIVAETSRIASERADELKSAATKAIGTWAFVHGVSRVSRKLELHFSADAPKTDSGAVPVWIRTEWDVAQKTITDEALTAGVESPIVFVYLAKQSGSELDRALAQRAAALDTIAAHGQVHTPEADEARRAIQTRATLAEAEIKECVDKIIAKALVLQAGGTVISEASLKASVDVAARNALARLFPNFVDADSAGWDKVVTKAKQGNAGALSEVQYTGDPQSHPVVAQILSFIGSNGAKGIDIRKNFEGIGYGWSRDAIDGSLWVAAVSGLLQTRKNGTLIAPSAIDQSGLGQIEFKLETTTVTQIQKLAIRKLASDLAVPCKDGEEAVALPEVIRTLTKLAESCGGAPPLPLAPDTKHLEELSGKSGNDLILGVYQDKDRLRREHAEWGALAVKAKERSGRWTKFEALLSKAGPLKEHAKYVAERDAIVANRSLLADPDPVAPLIVEVAGALREAVKTARQEHLDGYDHQMTVIEADPTWQRLTPAQREAIRDKRRLGPLARLIVGTDEELLAELSRTPLPEWETLTQALTQRVIDALHDAVKLLEPTAVRVAVETRTLKTAEEVDAYLAELRGRIIAEIEAGHPVVAGTR